MRVLVEDMLDFKLTETQKKLVVENANVIGAVFHKFIHTRYTTVNYDEIYGDAAIGLCRAAKIFEEKYHNKGNFFSFAFVFVKWAMMNSSRKRDTYYQYTTSLNEIIGQDDHGVDVELGEQIPAPDEWESLEYKILAESVYQKVEPVLTEKERKVFRPWLHGKEYMEIAKELGISPHTVVNRRTSAKKKCRAAFTADEIFS
jgi:RNA polymerase sigma factor (sigma-70 family)